MERQCEYCKKTFQPKDKRNRIRRFCSVKCASTNTAKKRYNTKGWIISTKGYKQILVNGKYIMEHRLIMEAHLGRKLKETEVVHHIDGNKQNNSIQNLIVMTKEQHDKIKEFKITPIECPHCLGMIQVSNRVKVVNKLRTQNKT